MHRTPLTLGAFGLGCVGQGFLQLLDARGGTAAHVKHVCVKDRQRERHTFQANLTYHALDILTDDEVQAIVELTNDPALALDVICHALRSGRNAITASKQVVASHLAELIALQRSTGRALLYEASCAASIPVLHTLETHFSGERILAVEGILNGTTNYILTQLEKGLSPAAALQKAQELGFAERDPASDLRGDDARYKLTILLAHAFGTVVKPHAIFRHGIEGLSELDLAFGRERGWVLRSVATAHVAENGISAFVLPRFVPLDDPFAGVRDEYNAVRIQGAYSGTHFLQGKGAGSLPTGLAVLGDVQRLVQGGGYGYAKVNDESPRLAVDPAPIGIYARIPLTHQHELARFSSIRSVDRTGGDLQVVGSIALRTLHEMLGEGREGFQVIGLPHLRTTNDNGGA
ncbi:MAG: homoserine dehydrogenase [Flavobacteriales bacterium]|nr:homoserine dehydrogenase [Flavobacteriales bacterium]